MEPWFEISVNEHRHLLKIAMGGYYDMASVKAFAVARMRAHQRLRSAPNAHVAMVDTSACKIQTQEVLAKFAEVMTDSRYRPRRLGFVAAGPIALMQVCRLASKMPNTRVFEDADSAVAWLLAPAVSQAA